MKKLILNIVAVALTVAGLGSIATLSPAAYAVAGDQFIGDITPGDAVRGDLTDLIKNIINIVLGVVGILAVVMMIMGGISFITSQGDAGKVTKARNTILYGVVGLIVALLAFAIVNFVLSNII